MGRNCSCRFVAWNRTEGKWEFLRESLSSYARNSYHEKFKGWSTRSILYSASPCMHRYQAAHVYTVCYAHARNALRTRLTVNLQSFSSCRDRVQCGLLWFLKFWFKRRVASRRSDIGRARVFAFPASFIIYLLSHRSIFDSDILIACWRWSLVSVISTPSCFVWSCKCSYIRRIASCRSSCCKGEDTKRKTTRPVVSKRRTDLSWSMDRKRLSATSIYCETYLLRSVLDVFSANLLKAGLTFRCNRY